MAQILPRKVAGTRLNTPRQSTLHTPGNGEPLDALDNGV